MEQCETRDLIPVINITLANLNSGSHWGKVLPEKTKKRIIANIMIIVLVGTKLMLSMASDT